METKTIAVDFGHNDIYPKIEKGLSGLEIGVLGECTSTPILFIYELCYIIKNNFILDIGFLFIQNISHSLVRTFRVFLFSI